VSFRDLPAEHETDSRASSLCCKEWHKQVGGVRQSRTVIKNRKLKSRSLARPLNHNFAAAFEHSVSGVADQIDQQLLKLVSIRGKCHRWAFEESYPHTFFKSANAANQFAEIDWRECW